MIPVAVVLIVLVIVFTIAIIIGNPQSFDLLVFVARIPANITGVYVTGAVTMLVLAVAGWLLWTGLVRMRAQHKEIRDLKVAAGARTKSISPGAAKSKAAEKERDSAPKTAAAQGEREPVAGSPAKGADAHPTKDSKAERSGAADAGGRQDAEESDPATGPDLGDRRTSSRDRADDQPSTTVEERQRLLDETDELTGDK